MSTILAIDTATEACSVALCRDGQLREQYQVAPRRHNQLIFAMLERLLEGSDLRQLGVDAVAYGSGPGSFTGLRIAASAVQGLAFAHDLPCIAVSTLACQAQRALREGLVKPGDTVFSAIDAAIGELYYAEVEFDDGVATLRGAPAVARPGGVRLAGDTPLVGVGSGCTLLQDFPAPLASRLGEVHPQLLPAAGDMLPAARAALARGDTHAAEAVAPLYVRDEISWKKVHEQGKTVS